MNIESGMSNQAHGYNFRTENGELDPNFMRNVLPKLLPKFLEIFNDPLVINEITQHEINSGQQAEDLNSLQMNEQYLINSIKKSSPDIETQNFEDKILLEPPNPYADGTDETEEYKSCASSTTSRINVNTEVRENPSKYIKNKRLAYTCTIAAVFMLATILAGSLTIFVLWLAVNSGSILILDQFYNACNGLLEVSVKSLDEYNDALEMGGKKKLSLDIKLDRPNDWRTGVHVHSSNNINDIRISGPFHTKKLTGLLQTIDRLEKLHLSNNENKMCTESIPPIKTFDAGRIVNTTVKEIILESFNPMCLNTLSIVHESFNFQKLETIRFNSGTINSENVGILEKMLEKYKKGLKKLEIMDTNLRADIFSNPHFTTFENVHELVLETLFDDINQFFTPLYSICTIFPNVQRLSFGFGFTQWDDIKDVYKCQKLESLQIKIWVKPSKNNFSLAFLSQQFPSLEGADIILLFGTTFPSLNTICPEQLMKIEGRKELSKLLLANLRITSNCKLTF